MLIKWILIKLIKFLGGSGGADTCLALWPVPLLVTPAKMWLESLWEPELPGEKQFPKSQPGNVLHDVENALVELAYLTAKQFN